MVAKYHPVEKLGKLRAARREAHNQESVRSKNTSDLLQEGFWFRAMFECFEGYDAVERIVGKFGKIF